MKIRGSVVGLIAITSLIASVGAAYAGRPASGARSRYLYVWGGTGSMRRNGVDMITVIDADPSSPRYGAIIDAVTVDTMGMMPHHAEMELPTAGPFFVNDFMADKSYLIGFAAAGHPAVAGELAPVPGGHNVHSFARLSNGHVIATIQFGDGKTAGNPGGLAEFDANGVLVRFGSSADPAFGGAHIRTYALTLLPAIDRVVTTSSAMDSETVANTVQVWRLSDLKLLKTLSVSQVGTDSAYRRPFEVRTMADGHTALMNTYNCGFYRLTDLDADPKIERVLAMEHPRNLGCSVPAIVGHYMVVPITHAHRYATLDIADPSHPVEVSSLDMDSTFFPHWMNNEPGSNRVVATVRERANNVEGTPIVMLGYLNRATGKLTWDERFRDAKATTPGVKFTRETWPNGVKGMVMPHAALFVP